MKKTTMKNPRDATKPALGIHSRTGDTGGPLQTLFRKVKHLHVVDSEPSPTLIVE